MNALFEQPILDFHERPLPTTTHREANLPALSGKIDSIIGMRRTGKTWFLFQAMQHYLDQEIPKQAYNNLKTQGVACGKNTLHDYFGYVKDTYLIHAVSIHSRSERAKRVNPRKVNVIDTGLANAFLHQPQSDLGRLLENFVFME